MKFLKDLADKMVLHAELAQERLENRRLRHRVHNLRRAIKDQQKATLAWKGIALGHNVQIQPNKEGSGLDLTLNDKSSGKTVKHRLKAVPQDGVAEIKVPTTGTEG